MKKIKILIIAQLALCSTRIFAESRSIYIYNDTKETVTVKGPTKSTNKTAIPLPVEPGKVLIKELEGSPRDTLDLTYIGNDSEKIKKFSKAYDKPVSVYIINWDDPKVGYVQSETVLTKATSF